MAGPILCNLGGKEAPCQAAPFPPEIRARFFCTPTPMAAELRMAVMSSPISVTERKEAKIYRNRPKNPGNQAKTCPPVGRASP